jgi:hypothetical protein
LSAHAGATISNFKLYHYLELLEFGALRFPLNAMVPRARQPMKRKEKPEADETLLVSELDWNFDNVPDDELAACCLWEFARESKSFAVSSFRRMEREESFGRGQRPKREPNPDYEAFLKSY